MSELIDETNHVTDTSTQSERAMGDRPDSIPNFEGETVTATKAKITSISGLEVGDRVFRMDESVKLVVECRVVGVQHTPNAKGELERIHVLKAIDSIVIDWGMDLDTLREHA